MVRLGAGGEDDSRVCEVTIKSSLPSVELDICIVRGSMLICMYRVLLQTSIHHLAKFATPLGSKCQLSLHTQFKASLLDPMGMQLSAKLLFLQTQAK